MLEIYTRPDDVGSTPEPYGRLTEFVFTRVLRQYRSGVYNGAPQGKKTAARDILNREIRMSVSANNPWLVADEWNMTNDEQSDALALLDAMDAAEAAGEDPEATVMNPVLDAMWLYHREFGIAGLYETSQDVKDIIDTFIPHHTDPTGRVWKPAWTEFPPYPT